ncbi:hypothetical protein BDZ85DRAFT_282895 [Elsinoe ampelina]|uniref:Uncharacterized protein n=1 Tax=Elsinoe ampelina TaxID=302913 RepID=A0A6A6G7V9_9PEZI|nr:hypothetical protein BDZ85DRAFT_282895 [Elsinoe ampelina]
MRAAELLSDLTSLRACDPQAALALVSARPSRSDDKDSMNASKPNEKDEDLKRAHDLIELHGIVKMRHSSGVDDELLKARDDVREVLESL